MGTKNDARVSVHELELGSFGPSGPGRMEISKSIVRWYGPGREQKGV